MVWFTLHIALPFMVGFGVSFGFVCLVSWIFMNRNFPQ